MDKPVVSVGMPVYNDRRHVTQALDAILAQTYREFELILSDNASTDGTTAVCCDYAARDNRIRYSRQPTNSGAGTNLNTVLHAARGEYFMWAASDDEWDPTFIQTLVAAIESRPECTLAFCPYVVTDLEGHWISQPRVFDYSARTRLARIIKLTYHWDDGCFYGIYRRRCLQGTELPVMRWVGPDCQGDNAYPVIYQALAAGDFVLAGSRPLWFKRRTPNSGRPALLVFTTFIRWKANVFSVLLRYIRRGSRSTGLVLAAIPVLAIRFFYDCLAGPLLRALKRMLPPPIRAILRTTKHRMRGTG